MIDKFASMVKLTRLSAPTGYFLLFFPVCFGLALAHYPKYDLKLLAIFFVGVVAIRSAGCIINDIFDKDFDKYVARTKDRPLANKSLDMRIAIILLIALLIISLIILLHLTITSIYLGFLAFIMLVLYPLTKRFSNVPQIFLGITWNLSLLIAYASITDRISLESFIMYVACVFWTTAYDIIYGFMDLIDDKKIDVKSMSILLEHRNYKGFLYSFYLIFMILFVVASIIAKDKVHYYAIICASSILIWQIYSLDISNAKNCMVRFKANNYVGAILAFSMLFC
jgi:4-hydroxybenzoate polyprenyltransferase